MSHPLIVNSADLQNCEVQTCDYSELKKKKRPKTNENLNLFIVGFSVVRQRSVLQGSDRKGQLAEIK